MNVVQMRKLSGESEDFQILHSARLLELMTLASSLFAWDPLSTLFLYYGSPVPTSTPIADLELPPESFLVCYNQTFIPQPAPAALPLMQSDALSRKKQYNRNGKVIPFNIDDLIDYIVHLQYTPEHTRAALEYSAHINSTISRRSPKRRTPQRGAPVGGLRMRRRSTTRCGLSATSRRWSSCASSDRDKTRQNNGPPSVPGVRQGRGGRGQLPRVDDVMRNSLAWLPFNPECLPHPVQASHSLF
jgi:hypothetical protein